MSISIVKFVSVHPSLVCIFNGFPTCTDSSGSLFSLTVQRYLSKERESLVEGLVACWLR